jgi:DNA-binding transcriptional LysR family regulator
MLNINLEALQILDAIDRRGSFAAAGKEMHKVASTISYAVAKLEQDLAVQLFERVGPRATLTVAGHALLEDGRHLLRAAQELEMRVRRVASGWEAEFALGLDSMFAPGVLEGDIRAFYDVAGPTRLRIVSEALSGTWEALLDRRVDLLVAAAGEGPGGGGYMVEPLGSVSFVFVVAPSHPLAKVRGEIRREQLSEHRAVVVADSARRLLPRTVGLLAGQDALVVPDMASKCHLQRAGLGFGFLPRAYVQADLRQGRLIEKRVTEPRPDEMFWLAWRTAEEGAALRWWRSRLQREGAITEWLQHMAMSQVG